MTFTQQVKSEVLLTHKNLKAGSDAFLYAVFKSLGSFELTHKGMSLSVSSENRDLLEFCQNLVKAKYNYDTVIQSENTIALRNTVKFSATFKATLLEQFKLLYRDSDNLLQFYNDFEYSFISTSQSKKMFVIALFLSCGSLVIPTVSEDLTTSSSTVRYHLEFASTNAEILTVCKEILSEFGFVFKTTDRKGVTVLYTKSSETISDFLVFVGASNAMLSLENVLVERSIRNNANRQSNCIYANINKMLDANERQINAIDGLTASGTLFTLSPQLQEIATLRKDNPDASMSELADIGKLTKSGVKHRLQKIIDIYTEENNG